MPRTDVPPTSLSLDAALAILKNNRRRTVLRYLEDHEEPVDIGELAETIAAQENDTTVEALSSSERKRVYVGLYQCHLPKMDDLDIVRYDRDRGVVEQSTNAAQLASYLARLTDIDDPPTDQSRPWYGVYGGVAAAGLLALAASHVYGLPGADPSAVVGGIGLAAVGLCAIVHAVAVRRGRA